MRTIRLVGLALAATVALGVGASVASAEEGGNPQILPMPTAAEPLTFTVSGGKALLETTAKARIECEEVTGAASFTSQRLGTLKLSFQKNCLLGGGGVKKKFLLEGEFGKGKELEATLMLVIVLFAKTAEVHF
jgi:hypothetical protein